MSTAKSQKAQEIYRQLQKLYPTAHCELHHETPFQLLIATILSAQCTDVRVNMVTPALFKAYPTPEALARAEQAEVETIIKSTGFYQNKAKNIIGCAQNLVTHFESQVPRTQEELTTLPGVGRKTANVVLSNCFGINEGVVVDTHVKRISALLGLTKEEDPEKIERDLMRLFPQKDWGMLSHLIIFHGRKVCIARRPQCDLCQLYSICPSRKKKSSGAKS